MTQARARLSRAAALGAALGAAMGAALLAATQAHAADTTLTETGSTLLYPLFEIWAASYGQSHPQTRVSTGATGSGAGEQQAFSGKVMIGASDAYLSDDQVRDHPDFVDIPLAIAAQSVVYNLPGLNDIHLRLDGPVLAGIYRGRVRRWDAPQIKSLNPGVALPHQPIIPVHRTDGSGDTFIFSQFLSFSTPSWQDDVGFGTAIRWPDVAGALGVTSNAATVKAVHGAPYSIGYVGISYEGEIASAAIGTARLRNSDGAFVLPTRETIIAGAANLAGRTPDDERLSLVYAPGAQSYPLVNYEYAIVSRHQASASEAAALRGFLLWAIEPSETRDAMLDQVHFVPLPPHGWELSQAQIQTIR